MRQADNLTYQCEQSINRRLGATRKNGDLMKKCTCGNEMESVEYIVVQKNPWDFIALNRPLKANVLVQDM